MGEAQTGAAELAATEEGDGFGDFDEATATQCDTHRWRSGAKLPERWRLESRRIRSFDRFPVDEQGIFVSLPWLYTVRHQVCRIDVFRGRGITLRSKRFCLSVLFLILEIYLGGAIGLYPKHRFAHFGISYHRA